MMVVRQLPDLVDLVLHKDPSDIDRVGCIVEEVVDQNLTFIVASLLGVPNFDLIPKVVDIAAYFGDQLAEVPVVNNTDNSCFTVAIVTGQPANLIGEVDVPFLRRPKFDCCSFLYIYEKIYYKI